MIDPQAQFKPYLKLLGLVILLGVAVAVMTFAFMAIVHQGTALLWETVAEELELDPRLFTVLVCTFGGLLVGLLVKHFGDHNGIFAEVMQEFGKTGRFDYRNAPGIVITALVSLIAGGSLGPEAPLADASGGLGTWLADRLKLNEQETRSVGYSGVSAMLASFIVSMLLQFYFRLDSDDPIQFAWIVLITVLCSTIIWVLTTFLTAPEKEEILVSFYRRVRPGASLWGPIVGKAPDVPTKSNTACNLLDWFCGCVLVYMTLFGIGKIILGWWAVGFVFLILAAIAGWVIYWDLNRRGWKTVLE